MNGNGGAGTARGVQVEVVRGATVESRHVVHVAVVDEVGRVRASAGDPAFVTFARSSIKALQALPLVEDGGVERFGLTEAELALCCASHGGEPYHVEAARSILRKVGASEGALACGPHAPFHGPSAQALAEAGAEPGRVHNNCSGKHAGMLALARLHDWPMTGYTEPSHPVQRRMLAEVARWTEVPEERIATGVDGCGAVTFAVPLSALAAAFARFGAAAERGAGAEEPVAGAGEPGAGEPGAGGGERSGGGRGRGAGAGASGPARLVAALRRHPEYVAGTDRLCTALMRATGGRILAKVGAEGVYVAGAPAEGLGVALKVEDGAKRAAESALLGVLRSLELITADEYAALERYAEPALMNTRGERVGGIRPVVALEARRG
ncbi:MAG TPA: asparaginase [Longimicrobiales bacterium]